jgi:putative transcriptional regulator
VTRGVPLVPLAPLALLALLALPCSAPAQAPGETPPNGLLLIARPELADPNFRRTVVLVTQTEDASTLGVILNRPLGAPLQRLLPEEPAAAGYRDRVYEGGPVMRQTIVAVYRSDQAPATGAHHVLRGIYLTAHAGNIRALLADPRRQFRLYAGFSGWAPRQLESEFMRESWHILPADAVTVFRDSTEGLWEELILKATKPRPSTGAAAPLAAAAGLE